MIKTGLYPSCLIVLYGRGAHAEALGYSIMACLMDTARCGLRLARPCGQRMHETHSFRGGSPQLHKPHPMEYVRDAPDPQQVDWTVTPNAFHCFRNHVMHRCLQIVLVDKMRHARQERETSRDARAGRRRRAITILNERQRRVEGDEKGQWNVYILDYISIHGSDVPYWKASKCFLRSNTFSATYSILVL